MVTKLSVSEVVCTLCLCFQSTCSPLVVSLGSLVLLALVGTTEGVKLQNYLNPESSVVDPEVRASILDRQGKQFQIYTVRAFDIKKCVWCVYSETKINISVFTSVSKCFDGFYDSPRTEVIRLEGQDQCYTNGADIHAHLFLRVEHLGGNVYFCQIKTVQSSLLALAISICKY